MARTSEREGRVIDHDAPVVDGAEEAGGVLLMAAPAARPIWPPSTRTSALRVHKSLLRFNTCGSVDDGKSTLIGRLLYESKALFDDQLAALEADSKRVGTRPGELDFALLLDGLSAEREQGITIDVAYRFFSTERRNFIVADTPGHEQYTRNMVTGASTADLSVILDRRAQGRARPRRGATASWCRCSASGTSCWWSTRWTSSTTRRRCSRAIEAEYRKFAAELGLPTVTCIPISAVKGDNILQRSAATPWYEGPTLMGLLDTVEVDETRLREQPLRLPVQWVNRPNPDFRGFAGTIVGGRLRKGDAIRVQPSGRDEPRRAHRHARRRSRARRSAGQSITITLDDEIDISRGDLIVAAERARRGRGPVRGDHRLDERVAAAARPQLPAEDRHQDRRPRRSRRSSTRSTSTRWSTWPRRRSS